MQYKVFESSDLIDMENIGIGGRMPYDMGCLREFLHDSAACGFLAKEGDTVVGFAYGYALLRPDGRTMFYLHSVDILPEYQGNGYGIGLMNYIKGYARDKGFSEVFLIAEADNAVACHVYEKTGGKRETEDSALFVYDFGE